MQKTCNKCGIPKELDEFSFRSDSGVYRNDCKSCCSAKSKKHYQENREAKIEYAANYYESNKDKCLADAKRWAENNVEKLRLVKEKSRKKNKVKYNLKRNSSRKARKKVDPLFKIKEAIRVSIHKGFKKNEYKKSLKSEQILGCSFVEFKLYIESKFAPWMNWSNHGVFNEFFDTWQFDHIIPLSTAVTVEDVIRLNHYTNFQPLESKENNYKSNKLNYGI